MTRLSGSKGHSYTNRDIAVMAVYQQGGALRHVHLEDAAMKAAELSPRRFCWKKYPDQINLEAVRIALKSELGLPKSRVLGGIRDGWMLTTEGFSWCLADSSAGGRNDQALLDEVHRELDRAKKTQAFSKMSAGRVTEVSAAEVEALLRVNPYFSERDRRERIAALANASVLDAQLRSVILHLSKQGFGDSGGDR